MAALRLAAAAAVALAPRPAAAKLQPNAPNQPVELNTSGLIPCAGRNLCSVLLDVPEACVEPGGVSRCPIGFFFHGHGGHNTEFVGGRQHNIRFGGVSGGVHSNRFIGVYPQGAIYAGTNNASDNNNKTAPASGWNDGSMDGDKCAWDDFACHKDPNDGVFTAGIVDALRKLGAGGHIFMWGGSNGANSVQIFASNAGPKLPIAGISAGWGELLAAPPRSGPAPYNWNQPTPLPGQSLPGRPGDGRRVAQQAHHGDADPIVPWNGGPRFNSKVVRAPRPAVAWECGQTKASGDSGSSCPRRSPIRRGPSTTDAPGRSPSRGTIAPPSSAGTPSPPAALCPRLPSTGSGRAAPLRRRSSTIRSLAARTAEPWRSTAVSRCPHRIHPPLLATLGRNCSALLTLVRFAGCQGTPSGSCSVSGCAWRRL